jgi:UDP:flavonoid glycosyltransferase YjiC (YdhE family)
MVLESRIDRPMDGDERARLDAVLARHRGEGGERRLVYAAFGSTLSADPHLLRRLLGVVAERPRWELVLSLGDRLGPEDLEPLPDRVHAFSWLPQTRVLERADVAVIHGGIGTVDECVLAGVPMLVYCGGETDMPGTTARVVHHEIGIAGDGRRDSTAHARGHIDRLLGEGRFRAHVRRLQERYRAYRVERVAERVVEQLLDRGSGTGPPRRGPSSGGIR